MMGWFARRHKRKIAEAEALILTVEANRKAQRKTTYEDVYLPGDGPKPEPDGDYETSGRD